MNWLLILTLVYVAVLVLALADGLIAIVFYLNGARANLAKISAGLKQVNSNVEPVEGALTAAANGLTVVSKNLKAVDSHLASLGQKREVAS